MAGVEKYAAPGPSPGVHDLDGGDFAETAKPQLACSAKWEWKVMKQHEPLLEARKPKFQFQKNNHHNMY